jgi:hypothetical protein
MGDPLARLRALLDPHRRAVGAGQPSVASFEQILAELDAWLGPDLEAALALAEAHLRTWPDELRCAGERVFGEAPDGTWRPKPIARLVRRLEFNPSEAGCDPALVVQIAGAPEFANLTILNLLCEDIDCDGAAAICNSPILAQLRELRLGDRIGDFGLTAIAQSPYLKQLERLELRGFITDDETAVILANSPHMAKLVDLQLEDDGLGLDGHRALALSKHIPAEIRAFYLEQRDD